MGDSPMIRRGPAAAVLAVLAACAAPAAAQTPARPWLDWFKPLVGRTWKATMPNGAVDVHRFELILNGQVVRTVHSVNDGAYGGEALVYWDEEKQGVASHYVTTAGFFTTATIRFEDGAMISHEIVHGGGASGVREVKAESRVTPDGRLVVRAQRLKDGQWSAAGERTYVEDAKAEVRFRQ
jgi:hypothetical protein